MPHAPDGQPDEDRSPGDERYDGEASDAAGKERPEAQSCARQAVDTPDHGLHLELATVELARPELGREWIPRAGEGADQRLVDRDGDEVGKPHRALSTTGCARYTVALCAASATTAWMTRKTQVTPASATSWPRRLCQRTIGAPRHGCDNDRWAEADGAQQHVEDEDGEDGVGGEHRKPTTEQQAPGGFRKIDHAASRASRCSCWSHHSIPHWQ